MDQALTVVQKRATLSVLYSVLFQAALVSLFTFSSVDIFHPISWMNSAISKAMSFYTWMYFFVLSLLLMAVSGVMKVGLFEGPKYFGSRFSVFKSLFSVRALMSMGLYISVSVLTVCTYLSVVNGEYKLIQQCRHSTEKCVVESYVYLLFCGIWSGAYFSLYNSVWRPYVPVFPIIQQLKFLRLKAELLPSLKKACQKAILPCLLCPIIYYWKGDIILHVICDIFDLTLEGELFEFVTDYLNFKLLFFSWLLTTIFMFSIFMMEHILNILLTEMFEFPVHVSFTDANVSVLSDVITCNKYTLVQNLGCFDLLTMAKSDKDRRREVFILSQPGGHPNNWDAIKSSCLNLIVNFTTEINNASAETTNAHHTSKSNIVTNTSAQSSSRIIKDIHSSGLRNLSLGFEGSFPYEHPLDDNPPVLWDQVINNILSSMKAHFTVLFRKTGLHYIFEKTPDSKLKFVFLKSLPVNNVVQALSFFASASLTEDTYGVVQKDLKSIVCAILNLKQSLDKLPKGGNFKRALKNEPYDIHMKAVLKATVRRSLYNICITFGNHINDLGLPDTVCHQINGYLSFRE